MPYMNLIFLEDFRPHDTDLFSDLFPPSAWFRTANCSDNKAGVIDIFGVDSDFPCIDYRQGFCALCKV